MHNLLLVGLLQYPRGITNPNYPGFQHLAHTLAEHFIDHQFDQSSDTDGSDDCNSDSTSSLRPQRCSNYLISDGNNNSQEAEFGSDSALNRSESEIFFNNKSEKREGHCLITTENVLHGSTDALDWNQDSYLINMNIDYETMCDNKCEMDKIERCYPDAILTPDILIQHKSYEKSLSLDSEIAKKENLTRNRLSHCFSEESFLETYRDHEPDLIKHLVRSEMSLENQTCNQDAKNDNEEMEVDETRENYLKESSSFPLFFGSSPCCNADIIGDFGKEMQEEMSMIVSGFRVSRNPSLKSLIDASGDEATNEEFVNDGNTSMDYPKFSQKVSWQFKLDYLLKLESMLARC